MLYYTGAKKPEDIQAIPSLSLGGYKSSTTIPNGSLQNLFPKITQTTIMKNKKIIRMIVIANLTPGDMENIKIWCNGGHYSLIKMSAVSPAYDSECNRYVFETVFNEESLPYQTTLEEYKDTNPLLIDKIERGKYIGLWVRKELKLDAFSDMDKGINNESCDLIIDQLQQEEDQQITEDNVSISIAWD